jgi:hypothetical protein
MSIYSSIRSVLRVFSSSDKQAVIKSDFRAEQVSKSVEETADAYLAVQKCLREYSHPEVLTHQLALIDSLVDSVQKETALRNSCERFYALEK